MMESLYFFIKYFRKKFHHRCFIDYPCYSFCLTWKLLFAPTHIGNMKTPTRKIAPGLFPPDNSHPQKLPPKKIPTQDNSHSGNSHPGKFPPGQLPPRITSTRIISTQEIPKWEHFYPANCHPG